MVNIIARYFLLLLIGLSFSGCGNVETPLPRTLEIEGIFVRLVPKGTGSLGFGTEFKGRPEQPAVSFSCSYDFYIGTTEVTYSEWEDVMGTPSPHNDLSADCPVEVQFSKAVDFCKVVEGRLRNRTGDDWICRLPRETEWEYAARWGECLGAINDVNAVAWYSENSGGTLHPVGQKAPNKCGLYDMLGNAEEWCEGYLTDSTIGMIRGDGLSPTFTGSCGRGRCLGHAMRGGSYLSPCKDCQPFVRRGWFGENTSCGFRILVLPPESVVFCGHK